MQKKMQIIYSFGNLQPVAFVFSIIAAVKRKLTISLFLTISSGIATYFANVKGNSACSHIFIPADVDQSETK